MLMNDKDYTVCVTRSKTPAEVAKAFEAAADVVVCATPTHNLIRYPDLHKVYVDCGCNLVDGKLLGNVSREAYTEDALITQFGFIKSKFLIKSFTSITLNTDVQKLTVYMGEEYFALVISPEWNNDFVQAIRKINPDVEFNFTLSETKDTNEK